MWATASLVMAPGGSLRGPMQGGGSFVRTRPPVTEVWPWRLDPVTATIDDQAIVDVESCRE